MLIFDSTGIQYWVRFLGLAMTTSISPCIHDVNGGNRLNELKDPNRIKIVHFFLLSH